MENTKCDAIVLSAKDYKDYDKLLTIFSALFGKQNVVLKGCKRPQAKQRFAGQPFFFGEFMIAKGRGYDVVAQVEPKKSFIDLTTDYDVYLDASLALKAIDKTCLSQNSERPFLLLLTYLTVLEKHLESSSLLTSKFYVELLNLLGFGINVDSCISCGGQLNDCVYFDYSQNSFVCKNCFRYDSIKVSASVFELIKTIKTNKFLKLLQLPLKNEDIAVAKKLICTIFDRIIT